MTHHYPLSLLTRQSASILCATSSASTSRPDRSWLLGPLEDLV